MSLTKKNPVSLQTHADLLLQIIILSNKQGFWEWKREIPASSYVHKLNMFLLSVSIYLHKSICLYRGRKHLYRESENTYKVHHVSVTIDLTVLCLLALAF